MKINSDQKSVLILAAFFSALFLISGSLNVLFYLGVIAIWLYAVRDKKKPAVPSSVSNDATNIAGAFTSDATPRESAHSRWKINSDQKSVLTLAGLAFFGVFYAAPAHVLSIEAMIVWAALAAWFYGVRTKDTVAAPPRS
jgi:hypothetical protein